MVQASRAEPTSRRPGRGSHSCGREPKPGATPPSGAAGGPPSERAEQDCVRDWISVRFAVLRSAATRAQVAGLRERRRTVALAGESERACTVRGHCVVQLRLPPTRSSSSEPLLLACNPVASYRNQPSEKRIGIIANTCKRLQCLAAGCDWCDRDRLGEQATAQIAAAALVKVCPS